MSTAAKYRISVGENDSESIELERPRLVYSYCEPLAITDSLKLRPLRSSVAGASERKKRLNPKRRLKGFLVEMRAKEARVAFIENGERILYDLPADQLQKAGITMKNQPFQMDEIEMETDGGGWFVGYRFLPLAKPSDAYIEGLNLDEDRKRKRGLIFKEFAKTQD